MRLPTTGLALHHVRTMGAITRTVEAIALNAGLRAFEPGRLRSVPFDCAERYTRACVALSAALGALDWQVIGDNLMVATFSVHGVLATLKFGTTDHAPYTHWLGLTMEKQ